MDAYDGDDDRRGTGRVVWRLVAVGVLLCWLLVGGPLGGFVGKLSSVADNDESAFLPVGSEATTVSRLAHRFEDDDTVSTILVYSVPGEFTTVEQAKIATDMRRIRRMHDVVGSPQGPRPSDDGKALVYLLRLRPHGPTGVLDTVRDIRDVVGDDGSLQANVTGQGGFQADQNAIFERIDGLLLWVALAAVFVLLVIVYRSPLLPFLVLGTSAMALSAASALVYVLADHGTVTLNGQSQGILMVLVVGACTDYSLLLVSRFREELRRHEGAVGAMRAAYRGVLGPIVASGATVAIALLCLLLSQLKSTQGVGPVGAIGIACSVLTAVTFLPAVLLLFSRVAYWPLRPKFGTALAERRRIGEGIARFVSARARPIWIVLTVALLGVGVFVGQFRASGTTAAQELLNGSDAVTGQRIAEDKFASLSDRPAQIVAPVGDLSTVVDTAKSVPGTGPVSTVTRDGSRQPKTVDGKGMVLVTLSDPADSKAAIATVRRLRTEVHLAVDGAKVGGATAVTADVQRISVRDRDVIIPVVLAVILVVLVLLLRSLVAPLLMMATVVLSFVATLGMSALLFNHVFDFPNSGPAVPLFAFVFLVALGVDYNIFLMSRVREEAMHAGTHDGIATGLASTGGVITSAGLVLAATFAALAVVPLLFLAQLAFMVCAGVLVDTLLVRSLLLPSLGVEVGRAIWWPARRPAR